MREDLEDALDLYEGMNEAGRKHWRERAAPSISFQSEEERKLFWITSTASTGTKSARSERIALRTSESVGNSPPPPRSPGFFF